MASYALENARGRRRLIGHVALVGRALKRRMPARKRLERALGREQAEQLVQALAGIRAPRGECGCGDA
jgi:hypothetical protein